MLRRPVGADAEMVVVVRESMSYEQFYAVNVRPASASTGEIRPPKPGSACVSRR